MAIVTYGDKLKEEFIANMLVGKVMHLSCFFFPAALTDTTSLLKHPFPLFSPHRACQILFISKPERRIICIHDLVS